MQTNQVIDQLTIINRRLWGQRSGLQSGFALHLANTSTYGRGNNGAVSVAISGADDSRDEVEQREDAVVAQLLNINTQRS